jgi:hypothetical protein
MSTSVVSKQNLIFEMTEATVSPLTKSMASKDIMWLKVMGLHQHVQQVSVEAIRRKSDGTATNARPRPVGWYCCPEMEE